MASTYPTSLDAFTNPTATSLLTSPSHAQQHSDINDAMEAVQTKLAIGNTVIGTYTAYTPTWTNLTVGNGTQVSAYCRVNNFVHYQGVLTFGSTTSITGSGAGLSLPITSGSNFASTTLTFGVVTYRDASGGFIVSGTATALTSTLLNLRAENASATYSQPQFVSSLVPFTFAISDQILWNLYYQAA